MSASTLYLVEEYLSSSDAEIRGNAVTALRAIGTPESIARLVDRALDDPSETVRARALEECRELGDDMRAHLAVGLQHALREGTRERQLRAYSMAAQLDDAQRRAIARTVPLRQRLALARRAVLPALASSHVTRAMRIMSAALFGAFTGMIALALYLGWAFGWPTVLRHTSEGVVGLVLVLIIALATGWRVQPFAIHPFRREAAVIEVGRAVLGVFVLAVILLILMAAGEPFSMSGAAAVMLVQLALIAVAVRLGTLVAAMLPLSGSVQRAAYSIVGTSSGVVVAWLSSLAFFGLPPSADSADIVAHVWLLAWPMSFGLANAHSRIDALHREHAGAFRGPAPSDAPRWAVAASIAPVVVVLLMLVVAGAGANAALAAGPLRTSSTLPFDSTFGAVPQVVDFEVREPGPIGAEVAKQDPLDETDHILYLCARGGGLLKDGDDPSMLGAELSAGWYHLVVAEFQYEPADHCARSRGVSASQAYTRLSSALPLQWLARSRADSGLLAAAGDSLKNVPRYRLRIERTTLDFLAKADSLPYGRGLNPASSVDSLVQSAVARARAGDVSELRRVVEEVSDPGMLPLLTGDHWNRLCWYGSLADSLLDLRDACNRAVDLTESADYARDSRGVYRARTGDTRGAIADFEEYVRANASATGSLQNSVELRRLWVSSLRQGRDPFTSELRFVLSRSNLY